MLFPLVERLGRKLLLIWLALITLKLITPNWLVTLTPHPIAILVEGLYGESIIVFPAIAVIVWTLFGAKTPRAVRIVHRDRR
ncbi:MAG TPA: hypothetical protein VMU81_26925 [Acetobacteraceae bacterium]|nr:hypothetical protein [Acetobacteraceae bacterium]